MLLPWSINSGEQRFGDWGHDDDVHSTLTSKIPGDRREVALFSFRGDDVGRKVKIPTLAAKNAAKMGTGILTRPEDNESS
jgi:hypothetical protein